MIARGNQIIEPTNEPNVTLTAVPTNANYANAPDPVNIVDSLVGNCYCS